MKRNKPTTTAVLAMALLVIVNARAAPYSPASADEVVADWGEPVETSRAWQDRGTTAALDWAAQQLARANLPGESFRYALAQQALDGVRSEAAGPRERQQLWYQRARLAQHRHEFSQALRNLEQVLRLNPQHVNAHLMAARVELIAGRADKAERHCSAVLGVTDLLSASACLLEVRSYQHSVVESYQSLARLVERVGLPEDERRVWLRQMLADMAVRGGKIRAAEQWIAIEDSPLSVSYLAQWADIQLQLGRAQLVLDELAALDVSRDSIDDALLLRLALAEKSQGEPGPWQPLMAERVALREARADWQHAAQLARYYLDVQPDAERALHWARINSGAAKEFNDRALLRRAEQAASGCGPSCQSSRQGASDIPAQEGHS